MCWYMRTQLSLSLLDIEFMLNPPVPNGIYIPLACGKDIFLFVTLNVIPYIAISPKRAQKAEPHDNFFVRLCFHAQKVEC